MTEFQVRFSTEYRNDLFNILNYLNGLDMYPENIDKIMTNIINDGKRLGGSPYIGHQLDEQLTIPNDYRVLKSGNYLQFYKVYKNESSVRVFRVIDGRTNYISQLGLMK